MSHAKVVVAIGSYAHTRALKGGRVPTPGLELQHADITPVNRAFRPMANTLAFDVSEMALVTYMLARSLGRPLIGLPIVLMRQPAVDALVCRRDSPIARAADLEGQLVGIRSYTQTTGVWLRGILADHYALNLRRIRWLTLEPSHVDGYVDPSNAERSDERRDLVSRLVAGELDAAVGLAAPLRSELRTALADSHRIEQEWQQTRECLVINHVLVMKSELHRAEPWIAGAICDALDRSADLSETPDPIVGRRHDHAVFGRSVEVLGRFAMEQGILAQPVKAEQLFVSA